MRVRKLVAGAIHCGNRGAVRIGPIRERRCRAANRQLLRCGAGNIYAARSRNRPRVRTNRSGAPAERCALRRRPAHPLMQPLRGGGLQRTDQPRQQDRCDGPDDLRNAGRSRWGPATRHLRCGPANEPRRRESDSEGRGKRHGRRALDSHAAARLIRQSTQLPAPLRKPTLDFRDFLVKRQIGSAHVHSPGAARPSSVGAALRRTAGRVPASSPRTRARPRQRC